MSRQGDRKKEIRKGRCRITMMIGSLLMGKDLDFYFLFYFILFYCVHGTMGSGQNTFMLVWRCNHLLSGFLTKGHLPRVSCKSLLSVSDKGDNEVKPGVVHRSPGIYLTAEKNPRNLQLGDYEMMRPVTA